MQPLGLGYIEGVTHDYKRHGTTTLFAAPDVLNGTVLANLPISCASCPDDPKRTSQRLQKPPHPLFSR